MSHVSIRCEKTIVGKWMLPSILILVCIAMVSGLVDSNPFMWFVWICAVPISLVVSPDFTIYGDGIEVHYLWKNVFVEWVNLRVWKTSINARIYAKKLTMFSYIIGLGRPSFLVVPFWHSNYDLGMNILKERLGDRFVETL